MTASAPADGPIRVCLVDDHAVVRRGLRGYLELIADIEVVGEAADGQAAVDMVAALVADGRAPHVVLMDLLMPGTDGVTATRLLTQHCAGVAVLAMTSYSEVDRIRGALEAGASGYLLKDAEAEEVVEGIRKAHRGEMPLGPAVSRQLARAFPARGRAVESGDRSAAVDQRAHGPYPRQQHPGQARVAVAHTGGVVRDPAGPGPRAAVPVDPAPTFVAAPTGHCADDARPGPWWAGGVTPTGGVA